MIFPYLVKVRPVCLWCGKKCGARHRDWPVHEPDPLPWDGVSWRWQYNPFCTLRCALAYARRAAEWAGYK